MQHVHSLKLLTWGFNDMIHRVAINGELNCWNCQTHSKSTRTRREQPRGTVLMPLTNSLGGKKVANATTCFVGACYHGCYFCNSPFLWKRKVKAAFSTPPPRPQPLHAARAFEGINVSALTLVNDWGGQWTSLYVRVALIKHWVIYRLGPKVISSMSVFSDSHQCLGLWKCEPVACDYCEGVIVFNHGWKVLTVPT